MKTQVDFIYWQTNHGKEKNNLLVLAGNPRVAENLLKSKSLPNLYPKSTKVHNKLNYVKGVIYALCLKHVLEEKIVVLNLLN